MKFSQRGRLVLYLACSGFCQIKRAQKPILQTSRLYVCYQSALSVSHHALNLLQADELVRVMDGFMVSHGGQARPASLGALEYHVSRFSVGAFEHLCQNGSFNAFNFTGCIMVDRNDRRFSCINFHDNLKYMASLYGIFSPSV